MMTVDFLTKASYTAQDLVHIMEILRGENGCPWDMEQDHHTIRNNLIEETYEAIEAIDTEDSVLLKEELGDVLLQVVFHSRMEQEQGRFGFDEVCDGICRKLIHRHPHIFGNVIANSSEEVLNNWDAIKKQEKQQETAASTLSAVSPALPALMRSCKVSKRAAKAGFGYSGVDGALADLDSELRELREAIASGESCAISEELGDLLFSAVNVSRLLRTDPEEALYRSTDKFIARVTEVEKLAGEQGVSIESCTSQELDVLWREAKKKDKKIIGGT